MGGKGKSDKKPTPCFPEAKRNRLVKGCLSGDLQDAAATMRNVGTDTIE